MLQVTSQHALDAIEPVLRRAAHRNDASILATHHVGQLLNEANRPGDAVVFAICQPELYAGLLGAEVRMAAFLPCRIAAYETEGRVALESVSPLEFCRLLNRPDLAPIAAPLETLLLRIMKEAALPVTSAVQPASGAHRTGLGATEDQVNVRGSLPQRIDCRGTKVEDLGGTGEHDAKGG